VPEENSIVRQRLGKQVSAEMDTKATIEKLFRTMFSIRPVQSGLKKSSVENCQSSSGVPSAQSVEFRSSKRAVSRVPEFQASSQSSSGVPSAQSVEFRSSKRA
jgi:hypothetical protein